jgi:hypothetical protein
VSNLLGRYDELLALALSEPERLASCLAGQSCVIVGIDGLQPDVCQAVRSAITDDGRPPLEASGLKFKDRLSAIEASLAKVEQKRGSLNR